MFSKLRVISLLALLLYCVGTSAYRGVITSPTEPPLIECSLDDGSRGQCVNIKECYAYHVSDLLRKNCNPGDSVCCPIDVSSVKFHKLACFREFPKFEIPPLDPTKDPPQYVQVGDRIQPGEFPYVVAVGLRSRDDSHIEYRCGGVLIDPSFVLTFAKCARSAVVVLPGGVNITATHAVPVNISRIYVHPDYIENQLNNNIALIQLQQPVREYVPACLSDEMVTNPSRLTVMGYVSTDNQDTRSHELLKGKINLVSNEVCREVFKSYLMTHGGIVDAQFCARDEDRRYKHHTGGPIMNDIRGPDQTLRPFVVGLTSHRGRYSRYLGIYTKVAPYIDWIESIVWINFKE